MNGFCRSAREVRRIWSLGRRYYLSEAYKCQLVWAQRLNSPILKKINIDEMYRELEQTFETKGKASAIDVDLFTNSVVDENYADELEDVIHRFRMSPSITDILPSTQHAVIRTFTEWGKFEALMRILNDRLNYGIFPDYYCSNLLTDTLLKQGKYRDAARIATFQMLQEDWNHPITSCFGLYACHMYLKHKESELWEPEINDEPKDEVKVRVKYIRNPFFDDHFDLTDTNHLIGKTFVILSKALPGSDPIRNTYELVGWLLYEKWDKAKSFLEKLKLSREEEYILLEGMALTDKAFSGDDKNQYREKVQEFLDFIKNLPNIKLREGPSLLSMMEDRLKQVISQEEKNDITQQLELYNIWDKERVKMLQNQVELYQKELRLKEIEKKKKELAEREEVLFFFEKKEELDIMIEKNEELKRSQVKVQKKKKKETDEDYIPPNV